MHIHVLSYAVLGMMPIGFAAFVLWFLVVGVLHIGREHYEGLAYNVSRASEYGDSALVGCILIGLEVLKRNGAPDLMNSNMYGWIWCAIAVATAVVWELSVLKQNGWRFVETVMDTYHNLFVVPVLVYLLGTMVPITFRRGTMGEMILTCLMAALLPVLVISDARQGRLQQCKWLWDNRNKVLMFVYSLKRHG